MADETKNDTTTDETKPDAAALAKLARQEQATKALGIGGPPRNLTRESIEAFIASKHVEAGKPEKEAAKLAAAAALKMIPEPN